MPQLLKTLWSKLGLERPMNDWVLSRYGTFERPSVIPSEHADAPSHIERGDEPELGSRPLA